MVCNTQHTFEQFNVQASLKNNGDDFVIFYNFTSLYINCYLKIYTLNVNKIVKLSKCFMIHNAVIFENFKLKLRNIYEMNNRNFLF